MVRERGGDIMRLIGVMGWGWDPTYLDSTSESCSSCHMLLQLGGYGQSCWLSGGSDFRWCLVDI